jgi:hypothetical protein
VLWKTLLDDVWAFLKDTGLRADGHNVMRYKDDVPNGLGGAHTAVRSWCAARRLRIAGPRWEVYGDWREDPAELETEVYYLLLR